MCCLSCFISFWCERNECRFSNDSLSLYFSGSINGLATRNVSCANGSHLWNCFQQEASNKNNKWERATAQRITTLTNMADVGRGASCWRVCHMMTPMGQERVYRVPAFPGTLSSTTSSLPSSIMARVRCEVVCQLDWVSSGGPLKPRWAVNAFTKWVVWILLESLYPQSSWEGAVFVNTKLSYYQLHA